MKHILFIMMTLLISSQAMAGRCNVKNNALELSELIGDATYLSEGDYQWDPVWRSRALRGKLTERKIRKALFLNNNQWPVSISTFKDVAEIMEYYIVEDAYEDTTIVTQYFRTVMKMVELAGNNIFWVRYGDDSVTSEVQVFLIGIDTKGCVFGLKTISIET